MFFQKIKAIAHLPSRLKGVEQSLAHIGAKVDEAKMLSAKVLIQRNEEKGLAKDLREVEFKVFSQFGDDGIIQYLIRQLHSLPDSFIEFGVENYQE